MTLTYERLSPQAMNGRFVDLAEQYPYNECKSCYQRADRGLAQRQGDKQHSRKDDGLRQIIPDGLAQSMFGYAFHCPDMIGGGSVGAEGSRLQYDEELFVRTAQPMMQFSA